MAHHYSARLAMIIVCALMVAPAQAFGQLFEEKEITYKRKNIDADWSVAKARILASDPVLNQKLGPRPELSKYGGDLSVKREATGFFRVEKIGERWWMIDPEGHPYFDIGVNSVKKEISSRNRKSFTDKFGSKKNWGEAVSDQLSRHGFRTAGAWSDWDSLSKAKKRLNYAHKLRIMVDFAKSIGEARMGRGHFDFQNNLMPVFDPGFPKYCQEKIAPKLKRRAKDRHLIGYFTDNELPFPENALELALKLPKKHPNRKEAENFVASLPKGAGSAEKSEKFFFHFASAYFRLARECVRVGDPNHLILGARFYDDWIWNKALYQAAAPFVDVISLNYYKGWEVDDKVFEAVKGADRPFMVTEWYTKALKNADPAMQNVNRSGYLVKNQADRGMHYQNFALRLLENPNCVGFHWFRYMDNPPSKPGKAEWLQSSNKGLVSHQYEPYLAALEPMARLNQNAYSLIKFFGAHSKK